MSMVTSAWSYWYYVASAGVLLILVAFYGAAYFRALKPRPGTLEWIRTYDRPPCSLVGRRYRLRPADVPFALLCCVAAVCLWGFAAWRTYRLAYGTAAIPASALLPAVVDYAVMPVCTAAAAYCLFRCLYGSIPASVLAAITLSADLTVQPEGMLYVVAPLLFLVLFLTAGEDVSFGEACLPLILSFAASAVGSYFFPELLLFTAALLLLLLAGCVSRFVHTGSGWLIKSLLLALLSLAVCAVLLRIPAAVAGGMAFPGLLLSPAYYSAVAGQLVSSTAAAVDGAGLWAVVPVLLYDWPVILCGLAAALAGLVQLIRRRAFRGLLAAVCFAALAGVWLAGGLYVLPAACVLALCGVWSDLFEREKPLLALLGALCPLCLLLAMYVVSWVIP